MNVLYVLILINFLLSILYSLNPGSMKSLIIRASSFFHNGHYLQKVTFNSSFNSFRFNCWKILRSSITSLEFYRTLYVLLVKAIKWETAFLMSVLVWHLRLPSLPEIFFLFYLQLHLLAKSIDFAWSDIPFNSQTKLA